MKNPEFEAEAIYHRHRDQQKAGGGANPELAKTLTLVESNLRIVQALDRIAFSLELIRDDLRNLT